VESHSGGPIEPLLEVLEAGWPWLPALGPFGLALAWAGRQRRERARSLEPWVEPGHRLDGVAVANPAAW